MFKDLKVSTIGMGQRTITIKHGNREVDVDISYNDGLEVLRVMVWPIGDTRLSVIEHAIQISGAVQMSFNVKEDN